MVPCRLLFPELCGLRCALILHFDQVETYTEHNSVLAYSAHRLQGHLANSLLCRIFHVSLGLREQPCPSWRACRADDHELGANLRCHLHRLPLLPAWPGMVNDQASS